LSVSLHVFLTKGILNLLLHLRLYAVQTSIYRRLACRKLSLDYFVLATSLSSHGDIRKEYRHTLYDRLFRLIRALLSDGHKGRNNGHIYLRGSPIIYIVACPSNCRHSFPCYSSSRESSITLYSFEFILTPLALNLFQSLSTFSEKVNFLPDLCLTISPTRTTVGCGVFKYSSGTSTSNARLNAIALPIWTLKRSEERRVGKESRLQGWPSVVKRKQLTHRRHRPCAE